MKKCLASLGALVFLLLGASAVAVAVDPPWFDYLGDAPGETILRDNMRRILAAQVNAVNRLTLPDLSQDPEHQNPHGNWDSMADALSAFVNIYRLSGDQTHADRARIIADWFLAWNDYRRENRDPRFPYIGWGQDPRTGYFTVACAASYGFHIVNSREYQVPHADEAWDTAAAVRGLLKYSEIDPAGTDSVYFQRAMSILQSWGFRDHASDDGNPGTPDLVNDGPYAAAGMRWYSKSNEPCEVRYVKNTDLVMGEQLFRMYKLTGRASDLQVATRVLYAQLWDMISHRNFGYDSFMIYINRSDPIYAVMAADRDRNVVDHSDPDHPEHDTSCKPSRRDPDTGRYIFTNVSCWNHLGFEGYDLYLIQQLISDLPPDAFPVPSTQADVAQAISQTMESWRSSDFGNPELYPWGPDPPTPPGASPTHVTAYNCALRFSGDPIRFNDCRTALGHAPSGGTIFYSLVPDTILTQGATN